MIDYCIRCVGWKQWRRRVEWIAEQVRTNPVMPNFLTERFGLELAFTEVMRHRRISGRCPWPPATSDQQRLYSFCAVFSRSHLRLTSKGKARLAGMLRDALQSDYGLAPLAFEMLVVAHLIAKEFDVEFSDAEKGCGFDFLGQKDGVELEVECKLISGDIGRQIHKKRMYQLGSVLLSTLEMIKSRKTGLYIVHLAIPAALGATTELHQQLAQLALSAIEVPGETIRTDSYQAIASRAEIPKNFLPTLASGELTQEQIKEIAELHFGLVDRNVLMGFDRHGNGAFISIKSAKSDKVLDGIRRQLRDAAKRQFSGSRPGILWCQLLDVTEEELLDLATSDGTPTGLQIMANRVLRGRPVIHTLAFSTPGAVKVAKAQEHGMEATTAYQSGGVYAFYNPSNSHAGIPLYDLFS